MSGDLYCSRCPATRFLNRSQLDAHEREHERAEREQRLRALLVTARADIDKLVLTAEMVLETDSEEPGTTYETALAIEAARHTIELIDEELKKGQ